jgi:hypothetical protein
MGPMGPTRLIGRMGIDNFSILRFAFFCIFAAEKWNFLIIKTIQL